MHVTKQGSLNRETDRQMDAAFTMTDLIFVLAVLVVLGAAQWPSMANTNGKGKLASCLDNHRQLARAWESYAQDNDGRLVGNLDGGNVSTLSNSNRTWVLGWIDLNIGSDSVFPQAYGGRANTNMFVLSQLSPLSPYLGHRADVFKCPADKSLSPGTQVAPRVRSVSMNSYMGEGAFSLSTAYKQFKKISDITGPKPSQAFVFIDEREDSINDGHLWIDMAGYDPTTPSLYRIVDYPADWHNRGANLSFADGHTETWRWRDARTMPPHRWGTSIPLGVASPNNPDVARIQAATTRRVVQGN
jgi:prepilin-type processing-associated H-X9-DG protein